VDLVEQQKGAVAEPPSKTGAIAQLVSWFFKNYIFSNFFNLSTFLTFFC
jgi:hypothetical protein